MSDGAHPERGAAAAPILQTLREPGAERFDPVGYRYIEALARRAEACRGDVQRIVRAKLARALTDYGTRLDKARNKAAELLHRLQEGFPQAAKQSRRLYGAGDFAGLLRLAAALDEEGGRSPLAQLIDHLARQAGEKPPGAASKEELPVAGAPAELKSVVYFRDTWSRLSVEQQLAQAMAQGPANAGPLNAHLLVLESLKLMRDVAPAYLERFLPYVDALLWLDQANGGGTAAEKKGGLGDKDRKKKGSRG